MLKKLFDYTTKLVESVLESIAFEELSTDEEADNWAEHTEDDEPYIDIDSLRREQETTNLVSELVKIAGITMEQFDSGDFSF